MDQETIQKYRARFETTPEADIPNAVIFEAIAVGLKSKVRYEINRVNRNLLSALEHTTLTLMEPLPFNIAQDEGHSKVYYKAIWEKMVEDAKTPEQAAKYEDHYRHTRKRYPQQGIKFTAKNKGTLQLHTSWR